MFALFRNDVRQFAMMFAYCQNPDFQDFRIFVIVENDVGARPALPLLYPRNTRNPTQNRANFVAKCPNFAANRTNAVAKQGKFRRKQGRHAGLPLRTWV